MFTERDYPDFLPHSKLDEYLAKGWFRMGQMIFTCHFFCFDGSLYSPVWIRLDLDNYKFRKSLRKIMTRNSQRFNIVIRKAVLDEEKEKLYRVHKNRFMGFIHDSLKESLLGYSEDNIYDTYEACVYDGEELVAVSFWDIGHDSIASIIALYNPDYSKYSLGFYTMLLEMQFGMENKMKYYYPGYVIPGYPKFDYKLRIGDVEFYDFKKSSWLPKSDYKESEIPSYRLKRILLETKDALAAKNIPSKQIMYQLFDRGATRYKRKEFLSQPLFLSCYPDIYNSTIRLILEYDLMKDVYRLCKYSKVNELLRLYDYIISDEYDEETRNLLFLIKDEVYIEDAKLNKIIKYIHRHLTPKIEE